MEDTACEAIGSGCVANVLDPVAHKTNSDALVQSTFPLGDRQVTSLVAHASLTSSIANFIGMDADILDVINIRKLTSPAARNGIGIVPSNPQGLTNSQGPILPLGYFAVRGQPDAHGYTLGPLDIAGYVLLPPGILPNASLVEEGWYVTSAHELAHTFGVPDFRGINTIQNAYDVPGSRSINSSGVATNVFDFMISGAETPDPSGFLSNFFFHLTTKAWISSSTFSTIFKNDLVSPADPEVLLVSGFIGADGTVELRPTYHLPDAEVTPFSSGANGAILAVDPTGVLLARVSFLDASQLQGMTDDGVSIPLAETPFSVSIPFSQEVESLQVLQGGRILTSVNANSQLLLGTIQQILDGGFTRDPSKQRAQLLKKAKNIESLLTSCRGLQKDRRHENWDRITCTDRAEKQVLSLREDLDRDLNDSTELTNPLQLTKAQVLRTIDLVLLQLLGSPIIQGAGRRIEIQLLPPKSRGFLSINSVTQGAYGSVYIDQHGGTIIYRAQGAPHDDSFTVTIGDVEGATVVKTIAIVSPSLDDRGLDRWGRRF
jgi:hypothetical protein